MRQTLKPFSNPMMKPPASPPTCTSSLPVVGFFHTSSELCSARTIVTLTLGTTGVTVPLLFMRSAWDGGSTPRIASDCDRPAGAHSGASFI